MTRAASLPGRRGTISTSARSRSMAAPTRSSATSSPKPCWGYEPMSERTFFLSEDQRIFRESLARFLAENWSLADHRGQAAKEPGFSREAWAKLAELGALGAFLPE